MKLSIGMACYDDFHGVAFSVKSLLMHHDLRDCEIIVVDNHPGSQHGAETRDLLNKLHGSSGIPVRYIPAPEATGTTQSRERIFHEAQGDAVLVMDCHVLLESLAISKLVNYYSNHPSSNDILSGPLVRDEGGYYTHFNTQWRGEMWGTWGIAWACPECHQKFAPLQDRERCLITSLVTNTPLDGCRCQRIDLPWSGHEVALTGLGYRPYGFIDSDKPFEIPGMGLGLFSCRRDAWLGFNPHFRGFGGEELYIHTKFRQAGHHALCLPFLKWWHRFGRPDGIRYPISSWNRIRNYVLGFQELGLDIAQVYNHFVSTAIPNGWTLAEHLQYEHCYSPQEIQGKQPDELGHLHLRKKMPQAIWEELIKDPVNAPSPQPTAPQAPTLGSQRLNQNSPQPPTGATADEIYDWCRAIPRDLEQHLPKLRELASKCEHVTEISKRRESTVAFVAAGVTTINSFNQEPDLLHRTLHEVVARNTRDRSGKLGPGTHMIKTAFFSDSLQLQIEPTDLLYIDSIHHAERLRAELNKYAALVRRFIILRGTGAFGINSEGGVGNGLFEAIKWYVMDHPEWFICYHTQVEYGLTVLSKDPADKPSQLIQPWPFGQGPGTELHKLLASLNIKSSANCDCNAKAEQMDRWGVEGCITNRELIISWLREGQQRWGWSPILGAIRPALLSGLAFKLNPLDPIPGLVDEAIRLAALTPPKKEQVA